METFNFDFYPIIAFIIFLIFHLVAGKKNSNAQTEGNGSELI